MSDYEPYGSEWAREVGRLSKMQLICMLAAAGKERDFYKMMYDTFVAIIEECKLFSKGGAK